MKKRFVVCLNASTADQNESFKKFIQINKLGWWHWLSNVWLLTDAKGQFSAQEIRDELNKIFPRVRSLVLEIRGEDDTWSGFGPNKPDRNMFDWLKNNWK